MKYGSIRYVNNLPVDHALVQGHVARPAGLQVTSGTPAELNAGLQSGHLDVSAVSAALVARGDADLTILPEAAIASHGPVDSVLLLSRVPIGSLDGRDVAVTDESATGALLLRILLENDIGVRPRYRVLPSDLDQMLQRTDAALLIGDAALRTVARLGDADGLHVLDLGEAWRAYSGLPMVYAVWATTPAFAARDGAALDDLRRALLAAKAWGAENRDRLITLGAQRTGVPESLVRTYYARLTHTLGPLERSGLQRFAEEAAQLASGPAVPIPVVLEAVH